MTPYDIAIVGAGSSGCAIAARASEDPDRTVLLVEAGPDYSDLKMTPFDLVNSHNNSVLRPAMHGREGVDADCSRPS